VSLIVFGKNQIEDRLQIGGQRGFKLHPPPVCGMVKHEPSGMKKWAFQ
jgi:hypothetical protein